MTEVRGTRWLIHNGASINFWHDNWTGSDPLLNIVHGPLNRNKATLRVCDTWDTQKSYAFDNIFFALPRKILDTINTAPKPICSDQNDLST